MLEAQVDRVRRQGPVRAGRLPLPQRLHEVDLALSEGELDAGPDQGVAARRVPGLLAGDLRLSQEDADADGLVHHQRVGPRGEIAAVDRDLTPAPHAIVAAKAHPVGDDHVRLGGVGSGAAAVIDRGSLRGDHFHGVAHAGDGAVVGEVRPAQHRVVTAVDRHHPVVGLQVFVAQEIRGQVRVEVQQGVADMHVRDHVETLLGREILNALRCEGRARAAAMGAHPAAAEVIRRVARRDLAPARQAVDRDHAGAALGGIGRGGRLLREREGKQ